uniref:Fringe-like glycosyltransferase domain-containing protein n=1 Tax=Ciona savignyi TaxID=51511 RepID=H2YWB9_CIOSA
ISYFFGKRIHRMNRRGCSTAIPTIIFAFVLCLILACGIVLYDVTSIRNYVNGRSRLNRKISAFYYDRFYDEIPETRKTADEPVKHKNESPTALDDIFISVKTTGKFHQSRVQIIIDTWFRDAKLQTYFFTDIDDANFVQQTGGHMVNTLCNKTHTRKDLSCKLGAEYDHYMKSNKRWWCHFDDDNYVNVGRLVAMLRDVNHTKDFYIGKPSLNYPFVTTYEGEEVRFWFATGGAGLCISRALAIKMKPWCSDGGIYQTSEKLRAPDDCTLGFIISNRLAVQLTESNLLHSHLEILNKLNPATLTEQVVSLSYGLGAKRQNFIQLNDSRFNIPISEDPTRFRTLHCIIQSDLCKHSVRPY